MPPSIVSSEFGGAETNTSDVIVDFFEDEPFARQRAADEERSMMNCRRRAYPIAIPPIERLESQHVTAMAVDDREQPQSRGQQPAPHPIRHAMRAGVWRPTVIFETREARLVEARKQLVAGR
jgi:hypothetical protein